MPLQSRPRSIKSNASRLTRQNRATAVKTAMGRSLRDFQPLLPGEQRFLQACRLGEAAVLGLEVPQAPEEALRVRATFLRFMLLGGDEEAPVHETGVRLHGAYVQGQLDLSGARIRCPIDLKSCYFSALLLAQGARVESLVTLEGSHLAQGINADRLQCAGSLFLRSGFKATGEVRLLGAQIGGNLDCRSGQFEVDQGYSLSADRAAVKGDVVFGSGFKATGGVRLLGAQIGGVLMCSGGQFEGTEGYALSVDGVVVKGGVFFDSGFKATGPVWLPGAQIGGNLECRGGHFEGKLGYALWAQKAVVQGGWLFDGLKQPVCVGASHMRVAVLVDEPESWAQGSDLDGLRYDAFGGMAPTRAKPRLAWLHRQSAEALGETDKGRYFCPQPWRQLQQVLREMGHTDDARQVGIAFEKQLRKIGRVGQSPEGIWKPVAWIKRTVAQAGHALFGGLSGYGYRPMRLMGFMVAAWLLCACFYWWAALPPRNAIGPSDPLVFQNKDYAVCVPNSEEAKASAAASGVKNNPGNWYLCPVLPEDYSTLSPLAYSLDIILPLVDFGQEKAWGPRVPTPLKDKTDEIAATSTAHLVRLVIWFETLFGWAASLLLVSIVSGWARRSEE